MLKLTPKNDLFRIKFFLKLFKDFNTIEVLSKMQKEFQACFNIKSEEDIHLNKNYKKDFLLNVLANNSENTYQQVRFFFFFSNLILYARIYFIYRHKIIAKNGVGS